MKVIVVGGGGREHAICWKLAQSPRVTELICAPGNAGTARIARNVAALAEDPDSITALAKNEKIELAVIGPEAPLCRGLASQLRDAGILVFGPNRSAAELEGSKAFAKELMSHNGIPTANYRVFKARDDALEYLAGEVAWPVVLKASGLAAGKGVVVCRDLEQAGAALDRMMLERAFGASGETVVVEDFLAGDEVSIHCLTDGRTLYTLPTSQDHKRVFDGDEGPNTGGMGAISPSAQLEGADLRRIEKEILFPTIHALNKVRRPFSGVLYAGLMMTRSGPRVLEYNVRFGDPETQALLPRFQGDFFELLLLVAEGRLDRASDSELTWDPRPAVTVVLTSRGYPGVFATGERIEGLAEAEAIPDVFVFHSGTSTFGQSVVTAGGRVLSVTALGFDLETARKRAYEAVEHIHFPGMHFRRDIGLPKTARRHS